jgi:hypothetical protein
MASAEVMKRAQLGQGTAGGTEKPAAWCGWKNVPRDASREQSSSGGTRGAYVYRSLSLVKMELPINISCARPSTSMSSNHQPFNRMMETFALVIY